MTSYEISRGRLDDLTPLGNEHPLWEVCALGSEPEVSVVQGRDGGRRKKISGAVSWVERLFVGFRQARAQSEFLRSSRDTNSKDVAVSVWRVRNGGA